MPAMKISSRKGDPCVPERGHRACQHRDSGMRGEKLDRVMPTVGHGKSGNDGNSRNDRNSGNDRDGEEWMPVWKAQPELAENPS